VAIAVISFAFVAILGLLPVGLSASIEAQRETRAAFIARGIFANIAAGVPQWATSESPETTIFFNEAGEQVAEKNATFEARLERSVPDTQTSPELNPDFAVTRLPCVRLELSTPTDVPYSKRSKYVFVQAVREER